MYTAFSEGHVSDMVLKIIFQQQHHWNGGGTSSQEANFEEKRVICVKS